MPVVASMVEKRMSKVRKKQKCNPYQALSFTRMDPVGMPKSSPFPGGFTKRHSKKHEPGCLAPIPINSSQLQLYGASKGRPKTYLHCSANQFNHQPKH